MDLNSVKNLIEQACRDFMNPAMQASASTTLQEFRTSSQPYEACKYIIEHSSEAAAQFQALLTIRDACLREWDSVLTSESRVSLLQYAIRQCLHCAENREALVVRQLANVAATVAKRLWGEIDRSMKDSLLNEIANVAMCHDMGMARRQALELLTAMVNEFNPATASEMGLPWDYHYECKFDMESNYLPKMVHLSLSCACSSVQVAVEGADDGICAASLILLTGLLSWDTSKNHSIRRKADASLQVRPPEAFRDTLLGQEGGPWPLAFMNTLSVALRSIAHLNPKLTESFAQLYISLCSMSGDIFLEQNGRHVLGLSPADSRSAAGHIRNMLRILYLDLLIPEHATQSILNGIGGSFDLLLWYCRGLLALASSHDMKFFVEAMASGFDADASQMAQKLGSMTMTFFQQTDAGHETAEECADILTEMWVHFSVNWDPQKYDSIFCDAFCTAAGGVFSSCMVKELKEAAASVYRDEYEYEGDEEAYSDAKFAGIAAIGRSSFPITLPVLEAQIDRSLDHLKNCYLHGNDPSVALEETCWVTKMASYILADAGDGETPLMPQIFENAFVSCPNNSIISLSRKLLSLTNDCKENHMRYAISSRLMEEVAISIGRWADTYLIAEDRIPASSGYIFGASTEGPAIAGVLVDFARATLKGYPGERRLHLSTCHNLLKPLTNYEKSRSIIIKCSQWMELVEEYSQNGSSSLQTLEAEVHLNLCYLLCRCALGLVDERECQGYLENIIARKIAATDHCTKLSNIEFSRPDNIELALNSLASLRGAARASQGRVQQILFPGLKPCFPLTMEMLKKSRDIISIYNATLDLAADMVEYQGSLLSLEDSRSLFQWATDLIKIHANEEILWKGRKLSTASGTFDDECDALLSLTRLLTAITNSDAISDSEIANTVFSGLESIIPLLSEHHLRVPAVCHGFFSLLTYMVEIHASKFSGLRPHLFESILQALAYGINIREDAETEAAVFEAVAALARHSVITRKQGSYGLAENETILIQGNPPMFFLCEKIIGRIVFDDPGVGALDFSSEPMLYILSHDPQSLLGFIERIIISQVRNEQHSKETVHRCLGSLQESVLAASQLDRQARQVFLPKFRSCIVSIRGAVRRQ